MILKQVLDNIDNTYIAKSQIHGFGLFANALFLKNTTLATLGGNVVTWQQLSQMDFVGIEWNAITQNTMLVRPERTKYGYINHSRTANLILVERGGLLQIKTKN